MDRSTIRTDRVVIIAFIRVREEKQSYAEVAKDLGISVNTVDVQLQKAIGRMWDMLSRYISGTEN